MRTIISSSLLFVPLMSGCLLLVPPFPCGDLILNEDINEECDDGNIIDADGCEADCTLPVCNNNIEDPGEVCHGGIGDAGEDPINVNIGEAATALAVGDIDGDGEQDIVFTTGDTAIPAIGDGEGDFAVGAPINLVFNIAAAGLADLDGDDNLDLAVVNAVDQVRIALGDGNGNFDAANFIAIDTGNNVAKIAFADLDGDNNTDIVTTNGATITVILNPGDIAQATPDDFNVGNLPVETAIADVNGDGELDLLVADSAALDISVLLGNNGGFDETQVQTIGVGAIQASIAVGDFDNNGDVDIATGLLGLGQVAILLNDNGDFGNPDTFATGFNSVSLAVADLDADQDLDIATADDIENQITVLFNDNADFDTRTLANQDNANAVFAVNINDDNVPDLLNNAPGLNQVTVLLTFP